MGNRYGYKQTFEEWCIENSRNDILDLWDYEKNELSPSEISAKTKKRMFFKCPNGIHDSESRRILTITDSPTHRIICKQCEYHNIDDLIGSSFGELVVIDYDKDRSERTKMPYWICECSCGNIVSVSQYKLYGGNKLTCAGKTSHSIYNNFGTDSYELKRLRRSGLYIQYRKDVLKKDCNKCIICGSSKDPEVHHIYSFALYPNHRFDIDTGICLCKDHHNVTAPGSFHSVYGMKNNTPEQLQDYVNEKRKELGINEYFDVYEYMNSYDSDNLEIDDCELSL